MYSTLIHTHIHIHIYIYIYIHNIWAGPSGPTCCDVDWMCRVMMPRFPERRGFMKFIKLPQTCTTHTKHIFV